MGTREDKERLVEFKRQFPEEYARKVAEITERKRTEHLVLEQEGYLLGVRSWHIVLTAWGLRLLSSNTTWLPYEKLVAVCSNGKNHIVPTKDCMCGIYAMKQSQRIPVDGSVQGSVKLWGRFLEAEQGYRAQYAYPEKLESFKCFQCQRVYEEWGEGYGFTSDNLLVRFRCHNCFEAMDPLLKESKYSQKFFSGTDVIHDLNETYGLVLSWDDMLEGIDLDLEG